MYVCMYGINTVMIKKPYQSQVDLRSQWNIGPFLLVLISFILSGIKVSTDPERICNTCNISETLPKIWEVLKKKTLHRPQPIIDDRHAKEISMEKATGPTGTHTKRDSTFLSIFIQSWFTKRKVNCIRLLIRSAYIITWFVQYANHMAILYDKLAFFLILSVLAYCSVLSPMVAKCF